MGPDVVIANDHTIKTHSNRQSVSTQNTDKTDSILSLQQSSLLVKDKSKQDIGQDTNNFPLRLVADIADNSPKRTVRFR